MSGQKFYLTKEGLEKLEEEFKHLLALKQEKAHTGAPVAFHSEELDIEFVSFKEDLELLEARINELDYIIKNAELIQPPSGQEIGKVNLGAKIEVEVDSKPDEFIMVGTLEANPTEGKISNESPVGKALLGHKVGDIVLVNSPAKVAFKIKKITY